MPYSFVCSCVEAEVLLRNPYAKMSRNRQIAPNRIVNFRYRKYAFMVLYIYDVNLKIPECIYECNPRTRSIPIIINSLSGYKRAFEPQSLSGTFQKRIVSSSFTRLQAYIQSTQRKEHPWIGQRSWRSLHQHYCSNKTAYDSLILNINQKTDLNILLERSQRLDVQRSVRPALR